VEITAQLFTQPRPLRAWLVKIDLTSPDIDFVVTPRGPFKEDKRETVAVTTLDFAKESGVQLAINATPFGPVPLKPGTGVDVVGLSATRGDVYSPPADGCGALVIDRKRRAAILAPPIRPEQLREVVHGVGGFTVVLAKGKNLYAKENEPGARAPLHPRTAVGLSAGGKTMWWLVVDGRQKGKSEGVNLHELAELGRKVGCDDLLNLDGGGSTTLVLQEPGQSAWKVLNTPVGRANLPGTLRYNGNNLGLRIYTEGRDVTAAQLRAIMPTLTRDRLAEFVGPLNRAMTRYDIQTPRRRAAFLAQLAHESGELRFMEEIASGEAYEGRKDLGNTQPGDGKCYKGRGPIQLTGRHNYRKAGAALGIDLERQPDLAAQPDTGCLVAGWFWHTHQLSALADKKDFKEITRRINGGYRGLEQREKYYRKALEVFRAD
jgi:predicted chitinase